MIQAEVNRYLVSAWGWGFFGAFFSGSLLYGPAIHHAIWFAIILPFLQPLPAFIAVQPLGATFYIPLLVWFGAIVGTLLLSVYRGSPFFGSHNHHYTGSESVRKIAYGFLHFSGLAVFWATVLAFYDGWAILGLGKVETAQIYFGVSLGVFIAAFVVWILVGRSEEGIHFDSYNGVTLDTVAFFVFIIVSAVPAGLLHGSTSTGPYGLEVVGGAAIPIVLLSLVGLEILWKASGFAVTRSSDLKTGIFQVDGFSQYVWRDWGWGWPVLRAFITTVLWVVPLVFLFVWPEETLFFQYVTWYTIAAVVLLLIIALVVAGMGSREKSTDKSGNVEEAAREETPLIQEGDPSQSRRAPQSITSIMSTGTTRSSNALPGLTKRRAHRV